MIALSIKQPYASLIAAGKKTLEIRSRNIKHRGHLLIVASARPNIESLPTGVAICVVQVVDCRDFTRDDEDAAHIDFIEGKKAWCLSDPRPVKPVAVKGYQGFFYVPQMFIEYLK